MEREPMIYGDADTFSFGATLRDFRKRRHLTQKQLAEMIGIHRNTIIRWEQGDFLPESKALVLELARHLHLNDQESRHLLEASLTAPTPYWLVSLPRNPFFTGREEILETLHAQLGNHQVVALTQSYALHGLGGIGKTQIALEYAYRHALEYSAVFWIEAETSEQITASLLRLAEALSLPERQTADQQRVLAAVQRWLSAHQHWLLIWDNLDNPDLLSEFLLPMQHGAILITTRCSALGTVASGMDLLPMEQEEGVLFLLRRMKVLSPAATQEEMCQFAAQAPAEYAAARELVTALGGLPLALDQAGAYLEETGCSFTDYLQRYTQYRARVLARRGVSGGHHPQSVTTTFQLSLERIEQEQGAADLLRVCALLQAEAIPEELFVAGAAHLGPQLEALGIDPASFDQVIAALRSLSLIQRQAERHTLSLHRLVQAVLLDAMTAEEREQWTRRVAAALDARFPEVLFTTEQASWVRCERLLPHALRVLHQMRATEESLTVASLAYKVAQYLLLQRGRYREAEPLFQQALRIRELILGSDHPDVARILNSLAALNALQARYREAESLYQRALHIREHALRSDHPDVARLLNNLAELSLAQGNYAEAEPLYQRALHIFEQALGPDHFLVATLLSNLARLFQLQSNYAEAEPLYRRALYILEQVLGPDHSLVAEVLTNLAHLSQLQSNCAEAELLYRRALHIWEQALGPDHPDLARALGGLGELSHTQGKFVEAEALYQRAWSVFEQALGPDHPSVACMLHNLANLFRDQERYAEAEVLYLRALRIQEQHLGQQHPQRADILYDLAISRQKQGRQSRALSLVKRAHAIRLQSLGEAHPKTVTARALYTHLLQEPTGVQGEEISHRDTVGLLDPGGEELQPEEAVLPLHRSVAPPNSENAALQEFLDACCELHPLAWCRIRDLWQAYEHWTASTQNQIPLSRRAFAAQMRARGCRPDRTSTVRIWRGIRLVNDAS